MIKQCKSRQDEEVDDPLLITLTSMDYSKEVEELILLFQMVDWWENQVLWDLFVSPWVSVTSGPNAHIMTDVDTILLLDEAKKQTTHLRAIRNWVAFAGIMFIVIPLSIWFIIFLGLGGILAGASF